MNKTRIEWCDVTLNPVVGCTYGCEYCYARKMNQRFGWIEDFCKPQFFPERLKKLDSKKPQVVFMNSLSDIADWERDWIFETFLAIKKNPQHKYLFLTKRFGEWNNKRHIKGALFERVIRTEENAMFGLTIDRQVALDDYCNYDMHKWEIPNFLSIEPILEPITIDSELFESGFMKWVIIGAETGNRKGKVIPKKEWIDKIVVNCRKNRIPVFMKDSLIPIVGEENMIREFPW